MDLNNLNIEDLKAKILTFTDEKTLIKSGIAFGAVSYTHLTLPTNREV